MPTYVVCQSPSCQVTYNIEDIKIKTYPIFCSVCNGILVDENGRGNLSGLASIRPVVGNNLLNILYLRGQPQSMKLKTLHKLIEWNIGDDIDEFTEEVKKIVGQSMTLGNTDIAQHSVDGEMISNEILKYFRSKGLSIRSNKLGLLPKKRGK